MSTAISPLRRLTMTLAMTGAVAFGAVAIAPAALADTGAPVTDSAVATDTAAVTDTPPAVVYDQYGHPVRAPKICTAEQLAKAAKKMAEANKKAAPMLELAAASHDAATRMRAEEVTMTDSQALVAERVAAGLDSLADRLEAKAQEEIDKARPKDCLDLPSGARF